MLRMGTQIVDVREFGVEANGVHDDLPALQRALAALSDPGDSIGGVLVLPAGTIQTSAPWNINKQVIIRGTNDGPNACTVFRPPDNATAIRFCDGAVAASLGLVGGTSEGSLLERLTFAPVEPGGSAQHAIESRVRVTLRDASFFNIGGRAVWIYSNGEIVTDANGWRLDNLFFQNIRGPETVFIDGGDTNGGKGRDLYIINVQGWGVRDSTFLGAHWSGCLIEAALGGQFFVEEASAMSTLFGCYTESGYPPSVVNDVTWVIGGDHGAGVVGGNVALGSHWNRVRARVGPASNRPGEVQLGATGDLTAALTLLDAESTQALYLLFEPTPATERGLYVFQHGTGGPEQAASISAENAVTSGHRPLPPGRWRFPQGFFNGEKRRVQGDESPTSGSWEKGDLVENSNPSAGDWLVWCCVQSGTFGTYSEGLLATGYGIYPHLTLSGPTSVLEPGMWIVKGGDTVRIQRKVRWRAQENVPAGAYRQNDSNIYRCTTEGVTGTAGPTGTGSSIADGDAVWAYVGPTSTILVLSGAVAGGEHEIDFVAALFKGAGKIED